MRESRPKIDSSLLDLKDTVVAINRVTKVVKGGKNLSFSALVVVGDGAGHCGFAVATPRLSPMKGENERIIGHRWRRDNNLFGRLSTGLLRNQGKR